MKSSSGLPFIFTTSGVKRSTRSLLVRLALSFLARLPFWVFSSLYCAVLLRASSSSLFTTVMSRVRLSEMERVLGYFASSHCQCWRYSMKLFSVRCDRTLNCALGSTSRYWRSKRCTMPSRWLSYFWSSSVSRIKLSNDPNISERSPSGTLNFHGPSASSRPLVERDARAGWLFNDLKRSSFSAWPDWVFAQPDATIQNSWPPLIGKTACCAS
mmetsp:Transcript_4167/g.9728  ORF Transcript_4167/g.9728 Transcript_4167/m.9728 type:complete len:213 (+) Transcript_4167:718-1356(+)